MTLRMLAGFAVLVPTLWAVDPTPLNVKPGQWQNTVITETNGQLPIPQEALDKMSPEQRARIEQAMKARMGPGAAPHVTQSCMTKEKLSKPFILDRDGCRANFTVSSSSRQEIQMECEMQGGKQTGTWHIDAPDPENVKGSMQMAVSNAGRTMKINSTFTAKWLGPTCTESK